EDHVGVVLDDVAVGAVVTFHDSHGRDFGTVTARNRIPFGHKIARQPRGSGEKLLRYGSPIGTLTADVAAGDHVHTHNLISLLSLKRPEDGVGVVVRSAAWLTDIVTLILERADVPVAARAALTDALLEANLRGIGTHGVRRLPSYLERIRTGGVDRFAQPQLTRLGSIAIIDGKNGIGHQMAAFAADAASDAAREHGVGVALVKNSNHLGFAGYYATRIAAK